MTTNKMPVLSANHIMISLCFRKITTLLVFASNYSISRNDGTNKVDGSFHHVFNRGALKSGRRVKNDMDENINYWLQPTSISVILIIKRKKNVDLTFISPQLSIV